MYTFFGHNEVFYFVYTFFSHLHVANCLRLSYDLRTCILLCVYVKTRPRDGWGSEGPEDKKDVQQKSREKSTNRTVCTGRRMGLDDCCWLFPYHCLHTWCHQVCAWRNRLIFLLTCSGISLHHLYQIIVTLSGNKKMYVLNGLFLNFFLL